MGRCRPQPTRTGPSPPPTRAGARAAERLLVVLRDGRKIVGTMRSFDQFANIVLEHALERVIVGRQFSDVPLGLYVIRGENVVLLGQIVRPLPHPGPTQASADAPTPWGSWSVDGDHPRRVRPPG